AATAAPHRARRRLHAGAGGRMTSSTPPQRGPRRLVVRIYLACLVLVLVFGGVLTLLKRQVLEPSQQRGTMQLARLVGVLAEDAWPERGALEELGERLRRELDADVTFFTLDD